MNAKFFLDTNVVLYVFDQAAPKILLPNAVNGDPGEDAGLR